MKKKTKKVPNSMTVFIYKQKIDVYLRLKLLAVVALTLLN